MATGVPFSACHFQDGADPLVERPVVAVVELEPAEPLLDAAGPPGPRDPGALEGQQDRQAPAQEMVPAGSTDRADDPHVGVALASPDRPARVCRRRVARVHQVGEVLGADEVFEEAGGLVPGFALPAPRGTGEDPVVGLAAVSAPCAAAAAAQGDGVSRATAALADLGAERPGSGDDAANALGGAPGGLANRLEQQPSVGGPPSETGAVAVGESHRRRDEASPARHRFTLPAYQPFRKSLRRRAAVPAAIAPFQCASSTAIPFACSAVFIPARRTPLATRAATNR